MTTLIVHVLDTPDGFVPRCEQAPGWRPRPVDHLDQDRLERSLRGHVSRRTIVEWHAWPSPPLGFLGTEPEPP